jgi:hypothetical protein
MPKRSTAFATTPFKVNISEKEATKRNATRIKLDRFLFANSISTADAVESRFDNGIICYLSSSATSLHVTGFSPIAVQH